jgi:L-ascorbate metabolism protein UlaG (beta-lactamase superfamily)
MTRRRFIKRLMQGTAAASVFGLSGACAGRQAEGGRHDGMPAYRPLNGRNLREIAARKLHHGDGVYLNPFSDIPKGRLGRLLKWKWFSENRFKSYYAEEKVEPVLLDGSQYVVDAGLSMTLIKHAGVLIKDADASLLIDPVFNGLFWFIDDFSPLAFDPATLPQPTHILITHGHFDHLDIPSIGTWGAATHLVCPPGYNDLWDDAGMTNRTTLDWFERHASDGREIVFLPCNHWTMRNPFIGPNTGLWGSYIIRTKSGASIYISGDTGYFDGFDQIGAEFDIDWAIFNLGAYEPRWFMAPSHMNPEETVKAFRSLKARHLSVVHWGTFRLGDEPIHFPPIAIKEALRSHGLEDAYIDLKHGHTVAYG